MSDQRATSVGFDAASIIYRSMVNGHGTLDADVVDLAAKVVAAPDTAADVLVHLAGLAYLATATATPDGATVDDTAAAIVNTATAYLARRESAPEPPQPEGANNVINLAAHRSDRGATPREPNTGTAGLAGRRRLR